MLSEEELTFKELIKKLWETAEHSGLQSPQESSITQINVKDVKKFESKLIERYETLRKEKNNWKERYYELHR